MDSRIEARSVEITGLWVEYEFDPGEPRVWGDRPENGNPGIAPSVWVTDVIVNGESILPFMEAWGDLDRLAECILEGHTNIL